GSGQNFTNTWSVGTQGFFGENMFVLLNGFNKMLGAEAWRSGKYDYIGKGDGLQIGVESIESSGFGHINFFRGGYFLPFCVFIFFTHQVFIALLDPILERVCHRYQLDVLCRTQSLGSSPSPSTATSDYSYFNGIIYGAIIPIGAKRAQCYATCNQAAGFKEVPASFLHLKNSFE